MIHFPIYPGPGKFRRQDTAFAEFADGADDELAGENRNDELFAHVFKRLGAANRFRLAFRFLYDSVQILARS